MLLPANGSGTTQLYRTETGQVTDESCSCVHSQKTPVHQDTQDY